MRRSSREETHITSRVGTHRRKIRNGLPRHIVTVRTIRPTIRTRIRRRIPTTIGLIHREIPEHRRIGRIRHMHLYDAARIDLGAGYAYRAAVGRSSR